MWKEEEKYQIDVGSLENPTSQLVLSSPFSYRLLYKNHKQPDSCSYDPFSSPKFVGNVINIAERALII